MSIKIDTQAVISAAEQMDTLNNNIRTEFDQVETAIKSLDKYWNGTASEKGIKAFHTIKEDYDENRYLVINNLTVFMKNQVGEGYRQTEKALSDAAAAFK